MQRDNRTTKTARVTANTALQALFSVPLHMKGKIIAIDVNNQGTSGAIKVQIQDIFTPSVGIVNASPVQQTKYRMEATVPQNQMFSEDIMSLEDTECLGAVSAICNAIDANCTIIVRYDLY